MPPVVAAERILNEEGVLVEAAQWEGAEVDVPFTVVDLDEAHVLAAQLLPAKDAAALGPIALYRYWVRACQWTT